MNHWTGVCACISDEERKEDCKGAATQELRKITGAELVIML